MSDHAALVNSFANPTYCFNEHPEVRAKQETEGKADLTLHQSRVVATLLCTWAQRSVGTKFARRCCTISQERLSDLVLLPIENIWIHLVLYCYVIWLAVRSQPSHMMAVCCTCFYCYSRPMSTLYDDAVRPEMIAVEFR